MNCGAGETLTVQDSSCSNTGTGCGWCLCETCYQCCSSSSYGDDGGHSHSPHTYDAHGHSPHDHAPHQHAPHQHDPHQHSPHQHMPHDDAPHSHTPHHHAPTYYSPPSPSHTYDDHVESVADAAASIQAARDEGAEPTGYTSSDDSFGADVENVNANNPAAPALEGKATGFILGGIALAVCSLVSAIAGWCKKKKAKAAQGFLKNEARVNHELEMKQVEIVEKA